MPQGCSPQIGWHLRQTLISFVLFLVLGGEETLAQDTNATCLSSWNWTFNSAGKSPCKVASELQGVCDAGWFVDALPDGYHYVGPKLNTSYEPNLCDCSSVVYQLMSACAACQNRTYITYPNWGANCSSIAIVEGEYRPSLIPPGTLVPNWAYIKPSIYNEIFNIDAAQGVGDKPESSQVFSSTGTTSSTSFTVSTVTTSASTDTYPTIVTTTATNNGGGGGRSSNTGAIVGGVVGGVVGLALVAVLAMLVFKRSSSGGDPAGYPQGLSQPTTIAGNTQPASYEEPWAGPHAPRNPNGRYSGLPEA